MACSLCLERRPNHCCLGLDVDWPKEIDKSQQRQMAVEANVIGFLLFNVFFAAKVPGVSESHCQIENKIMNVDKLMEIWGLI